MVGHSHGASKREADGSAGLGIDALSEGAFANFRERGQLELHGVFGTYTICSLSLWSSGQQMQPARVESCATGHW